MQDIQDKPLLPVDQAAGNGKPYDEPHVQRSSGRWSGGGCHRHSLSEESVSRTRRLAQLIDQFAASLAELGVEAIDKAMIYLPNCRSGSSPTLGFSVSALYPYPSRPFTLP